MLSAFKSQGLCAGKERMLTIGSHRTHNAGNGEEWQARQLKKEAHTLSKDATRLELLWG